MKTKMIVPLLFLSLAAAFVSGCYSPTRAVPLHTVSFPDVSLLNPAVKQQGTVSVHVTDTRAEKPKVGKMGGRIGANAIFVIEGGLEPALADAVKDALERAGYTVAPAAPATVEVEVLEFRVYANGWTQGAKETMRFQVRDKSGAVLWEKTVKGEDGGMDLVDSFAEKSMDVALTRLLNEAINEFTSASFHQSVTKAAEVK